MKTLAVTRPVGQGSDTASLIRKRGWSPLIFHTIELEPRPASLIIHELKEIASGGIPDWFVFMSPRGAALFFKTLQSMTGPASGILERSRILAVGSNTKESLRQLGARNVETPNDYSSEGVAQFLSRTTVRGKRVVLTRSSEANDILEKRLIVEGALTTTLRLYDSALPADHRSTSRFLSELRSGTITATLFTSALSASNLFKMAGPDFEEPELRRLLGNCLVGAIGPTTLDRLRALGLREASMPKRFLIEDAVSSLIDAAEKNASAPS